MGTRPVRSVVERGVVRAVVLALEGHELLAEEPLHEQHRLLEAVEALLLLRPGRTDDDLVERFAGAHAEDDAAGRQAAQRGEGLCHDGRVVAQRRRQDARAQRDALRGDRGGAQPGQGVGGVAVGVAPGLEVVARPDRFEAVVLRRDRPGPAAGADRTARPRPCIRVAACRPFQGRGAASGLDARVRRPRAVLQAPRRPHGRGRAS